jgi:hypothetical protein
VVSKILVSVALAVGVAVAIAAPASADPSVFNDLSCGCPQIFSNGGPSVDQMNRGVDSGLSDLQAIRGQQ